MPLHCDTIDTAAATRLPREEKMEEYEVSSVVRGFHVYQRSWSPSLEEQLECLREASNDKDRYAVAVLRHGSVVGHIPRRISAACSLFIERNGRIHCRITGTRQYSADLPLFCKILEYIDISDSRSRRTLDPGAIHVRTYVPGPRAHTL